MERPHQAQACNMGSPLRMSILQRSTPSLLPDPCSFLPKSPFCKITDESFPYISGIFDDTMENSCMSNETVARKNLPDQNLLKSVTKSHDVVIQENQAKSAYSSWLDTPLENDVMLDFSKSFQSPQEDHKDINNVSKVNSKGDTLDVSCHSLESISSTEKTKNQTKNRTFDMSKDLKERSSGLKLAKPVPNEATGSSNVTFEKSVELQEKSSGLSCTISNDDASVNEKHINGKHFNSTVDIFGLSNSSTEKASNQNLNGTVDITWANGSKHEQSNEECACSNDCTKQGTFTKPTEEANVNVDLTAGVSTEVARPGSVNMKPVDGTFTKHTPTTALTPSEPVPDSTTNSTMNVVKSSDVELPAESTSNGSATVKDAPVSGPSVPVNSAAPGCVEVIDCSDGSLDLSETRCIEEPQVIFKRKNGTSNGESCLNLDISQSSMFSMDEMLDLQPCPLVASTPIVMGKGFDGLGSVKYGPTNMQKQLCVNNNTQPNDYSVGVSEHEGSDVSKTNQLSVKTVSSNQIQKVSANATSEAAIGNKPLSKLTVRRRIPQPSCKANIPNAPLLPRPSTLEVTSAVVKLKIAAGTAQTLNQPTRSSSALHSMRRTVQLNNGKIVASVKNISTSASRKSLYAAVSTTTHNVTADRRAGEACMTLPNSSGVQPSGRGRFGFKPHGSAVSSAKTGPARTNDKPTGLSAMKMRNSQLPGPSQTHVSSDALSLAKRMKTDLQNQPSVASSGSGTAEGVQKDVTASTDIKSRRPNTVCENCTLLQEKLRTFHEEIGGFLQEPGQLQADCNKWVSLQHKLESYLEEVRTLHAGHH